MSVDDDLFAPIQPVVDKLISISDIINPELKDSNGARACDLFYNKGTEFQIYGQDVIYVVAEQGTYYTAKAKIL